MGWFKKLRAKILLLKSNQKFHPSYYEVEADGLTTAEHIALNDEYIRCMVKFSVPMVGLDEYKLTLWMSDDKKSIICMFTFNKWHNLYLRIGLKLDVAIECITIFSQEKEEELKLLANA